MIGNDIIDLRKAKVESNWQRAGWLDKIYNPSEINCVANSTEPFSTVWRIWSMKESAYKIFIQQGNAHAFNPKHFTTAILDDKHGSVQYANHTVLTTSTTYENYIATIAFTRLPEKYNSNILTFPNQDITHISEHLRHSLLDSLSASDHYNRLDLSIKSNAKRVPKVYWRDQELQYDISMSHHGQYGSYIISKY